MESYETSGSVGGSSSLSDGSTAVKTYARDENGSSPLHIACREDFETTCKLLDLNADPMARNDKGDTPLHYVASAEMIDVMLQSGADINAQNSQQRTPLHIAVVFR